MVERINSVLADQWALLRLLRKLEPLAPHEGLRHVLKRIRMDISISCGRLAAQARAAGGKPAEEPGPLMQRVDALADFSALVALLQEGMEESARRLEGELADGLSPATVETFGAMRRSHRENLEWLKGA